MDAESRSTPDRSWFAALEPLWVTGLAVLILFIVKLFSLQGEKFDWSAYLVLGTLFPALVILQSLLADHSGTAAKVRFVMMVLVGFLLIAPLFTLRVPFFRSLVVVSIVQTLVAWRFLQLGAHVTAREISARKLLQLAVLWFVILMSWGIASKYVWWVGYETFIFGSTLSFLTFVVLFLLALFAVYDLNLPPGEKTRVPITLIGNLLAILIIAFVSIRTDRIFGEGELFHWITYTGVAESVRQGSWLLWDAPSHYGFLSIQILAWFPTNTTWEALFIVNGVLNFLIALMLFFLFRSLGTGFLNLGFALAITLAAVFFKSGLTPYFLGPSNLPNIGGMRFFWCFALVAILFFEYRFQGASRRPLLLGSVVWLIGVLWSIESAVYCSVIWLPALVLLSWRKTLKTDGRRATVRERLSAVWQWWLMPPALLAVSVLLISAYYLARLRHGPDWRSYIEYARAYGGGFKALPINPAGEVWDLILVFCAFATTAVYFFRKNREHRAMPLLIGTLGGLWATGSYFVSRSHPNNAHNLSAIFCAVIGLTIYLLMRERENSFWATLVRSSFVPVLVMVMVVVFANRPALTEYLTTPQGLFLGVEQLIPITDPELDTLLNASQVKPEDRVVFIGRSEIPIFSGWTYNRDGKQQSLRKYNSWLPVHLYALVPLNQPRRDKYLGRFTERVRTGGWLIEYKTDQAVYPWLSDYIKLHYVPGRTFENQNWKLTWYDYKN